jgi:3-hydroxy-3-methylglutaryl CoA synthase
MMIDYREAFRRSVATFVAGATASPLTAAVFDVSFFKAAGVAGLIAVWNWLGRVAEAWVKS